MPRRDLGGILIGLIIVVVGGYFILRDTLGLQIPDIGWNQLWPLIIVAVGIAIVAGAWNREGPRRP